MVSSVAGLVERYVFAKGDYLVTIDLRDASVVVVAYKTVPLFELPKKVAKEVNKVIASLMVSQSGEQE